MYFGGDIFFKNNTTYPIFKYYKTISRDPPFSLIFFRWPPFKAINFYVTPPPNPTSPPYLVKNERSLKDLFLIFRENERNSAKRVDTCKDIEEQISQKSLSNSHTTINHRVTSINFACFFVYGFLVLK